MSEIEGRDRKRRRLGPRDELVSLAPRCCSITDLPDVVLKECLSFVGTGHYRFVAGTCHKFLEQYPFPKKTTWKNAVASVSRAKFCLEDTSPENREEVLKTLQHTAASLGKVNVLQWIFDSLSRALSRNGFVAAGKGGHLNVLEWGDGMGMTYTWFSHDLCRAAAGNGHVHMLEWIRQRNIDMQYMKDHYIQHPASGASLGGHITVLKWLKDNNLMPTDTRYVWIEATRGNQIHVLDWFHDNGFPLHQFIVEAASLSGQIGALEWAQNHGVPFTALTCTHAALSGHLEVVKWLRENGYPWDGNTIYYAERRGHLDIVQWARENGCPEFE